MGDLTVAIHSNTIFKTVSTTFRWVSQNCSNESQNFGLQKDFSQRVVFPCMNWVKFVQMQLNIQDWDFWGFLFCFVYFSFEIHRLLKKNWIFRDKGYTLKVCTITTQTSFEISKWNILVWLYTSVIPAFLEAETIESQIWTQLAQISGLARSCIKI